MIVFYFNEKNPEIPKELGITLRNAEKAV